MWTSSVVMWNENWERMLMTGTCFSAETSLSMKCVNKQEMQELLTATCQLTFHIYGILVKYTLLVTYSMNKLTIL